MDWRTVIGDVAGFSIGSLGLHRLDVEHWSRSRYWIVFLGMTVGTVAIPTLYTGLFPDPNFDVNHILNGFLLGSTLVVMSRRLEAHVRQHRNRDTPRGK